MASLLIEARKILARYGIRLRKRWGQNLLVDEQILEEIVEAADLKESSLVLEIGPGIGTLTRRLAKEAKMVIAVEIDPLLVKLLKQELKGYNNVEIIQGDILKLSLSTLYSLLSTKIKVVANLPYYITSPILLHLLEEKERVESMVIMVQKEVGERILAAPGGREYGLLSIALSYHAEPRLITHVPRTSFWPSPKVEGVVIGFRVFDEPRIEVKDGDLFFKIAKVAFAKRRKMLINSLSIGFGIEREEIEHLLLQANIDPKRRPETLSLQEFARLSNLFWEKIH